MSRQQTAVIGLGSFGSTVARELAHLGHEVLGVDFKERSVEALADILTHAVVADATDERALEELNLGHYDTAVVAIGENVEASILCTMQLKSMGIRQVWVKALTDRHHQILEKIGASRIIRPEHEMGLRVAQALNYPMVNDYIDLGGGEFIVEILAWPALDNKRLADVLASARSRVGAIMIKRQREVYRQPTADFVVRVGDQIVLEGQLDELRRLARVL